MTPVSVIVVNWNGRAYLGPCLEALLAQEPPPGEVLLVDNHSDDGSREFVAERFPCVRIVDTGANLGPAAARNRGLQEARHSLCLLLDNDVFLEPGSLAALREAVESDSRVGVAQARSVCADRPDVVHYDFAELHYLGTLVLRNWFTPLDRASAPPNPVGAVIALCLLVRRDVVLAAGGFDEELFILYEDNDLSWNLRMRGYHLRHVPSAICRHAGGTAGLSFRSPEATYTARRAYLHARNRWLVLQRNASLRTLILTAPAQCLYALVYTAFAGSRGHFLAVVRGHFAALWAIGRSLRIRRERQRARTVPDRALLVAAPMTTNPGLADRGARAWLRRTLDHTFAAWWRLVR